jgi:hypothetical protein
MNKNKTTPKPKIFLTFEQWKVLGRYVKTGEKSIQRNIDGVCVFELNQTGEPDIIVTSPKIYGCSDCGDDPYCEEIDPFFNQTLHDDYYTENNYKGFSG